MESQYGRSVGGQRSMDHGRSRYFTYKNSVDDRKNLDWKAKSTIGLCLSNSVLLNVSEEATSKDLWEKLGKLYQYKSLVNKLFLRNNMYNLRMRDGDSVEKHLNSFNTVVS
jgi:hypothetical protein